MRLHRLRFAGALAALALNTLAVATLHAALPPIGSENVAIADPDVPAPPTEPCIVALFDDFTFIGFDAQTFDYAPPADCPGPWQKVVLRADFDVTAGRQFDRTAKIWLGGANIYYGTTQEPRAQVAPSWHIERDVTDLSALFAAPSSGRVDLGNVVDDTYTGIIHGSASLAFYPPVATSPDEPPRPDRVLALAADATGGTVDVADADDRLAATFTLPTNVRRAFLDVVAQSQSSDEFWYLCVPDELADELQSCPGTGFREADVYIDGTLAGIAPVFPWIFTGGIDPYLWRPSPGIQTLSFEPYRVDLTPFAGVLSDGAPHEISVGVFNAQSYFSTTANLLLYLDPDAAQVTGEVTANTLALPTVQVESNLSSTEQTIVGTLDIATTRDYEIAGYVQTSAGRIDTTIAQHVDFSNAQIFDIVGDSFRQRLQQATTIDTTTTIETGAYAHVLTDHREWPLAIDYAFYVTTDGAAQVTTVDQGLVRAVDVGIDGYTPHHASLDQRLSTTDTLLFDTDFNSIGRTGQRSSSSYTYLGPVGACYDRSIATEGGVLTSVTDGTACADGANTLTWFDAFYNAGSSIFGATVQILP